MSQMSMDRKTAVIFGGSGAIGAYVGHALARQGAHVHLGARNRERLKEAAAGIRAGGGKVGIFEVDALDGQATSERIAEIVGRTGGIDIVVNATSFMHDQGKEIGDLSRAEFMQGVVPFLSAQFNICKAVAPHMGGERFGPRRESPAMVMEPGHADP
jgi:3-oxoacyl-[acyl-carrier protein] reductase